ncbi:MAG: DNA repair protein RecO [Clostridia bacterium]|nr:DNA repair protein RecO [Clostridia bacterium]
MRKTFEGLILSHTVLKERDKILTILTADMGKVSVYASNVRSLKRGSLAYTMPFQFCRFEVECRTGGMTLVKGDVLHSFYDITNDLSAFALGQYILDIARELTVENNNEADMLRLTLNTLYLIQKGERSLQHIKATFEFRAMAISGYKGFGVFYFFY